MQNIAESSIRQDFICRFFKEWQNDGVKELNKDQIQAWLDEYHDGDRRWLAAKTGTSKGTVDQWFSSGFSKAALATIRLLMEKDKESVSSADDETALIPFTAGEFELIEKARAIVGSPTRPVFYRDAIMQFVQETNHGAAPNSGKNVLPMNRAAEEPGTYGKPGGEGTK